MGGISELSEVGFVSASHVLRPEDPLFLVNFLQMQTNYRVSDKLPLDDFTGSWVYFVDA